MSDTNTDLNSPQVAGCQQEPCSTVLYFGCMRGPGHYLHHPTEGEVRRMDQSQPWGNKIDGWVFKDSKAKDDLGVVHSAKLNGWTLVAWADRSVDSRHGSHSTFIAEADITPERLIELAREQWPKVFSRPGFPSLSNVKVMAHPLAGANVDRWVEVVTWWEHQKQRG